MSDSGQFGLFQDDGKGPVWRASFSDFAAAKLQAQKLAEAEHAEFFVYCFKTFSEIARVFSPKRAAAKLGEDRIAPPGPIHDANRGS